MSWQPDPRIKKRLGAIYDAIVGGADLDNDFKLPPSLLKDIGGHRIAVVSELQLDTDGWPDGRGDPDWQAETSLRYADGSSVNANRVPFFVLPGGWYQQHGAGLGDFGAFLFADKLAFGIFADQGPKNKLGEGSIELLRQLGFERIRQDGSVINAGSQPGVVSIIFCGSADGHHYAGQTDLLAAIAASGQALFDAAAGTMAALAFAPGAHKPDEFVAWGIDPAFADMCASVYDLMEADGFSLACNVSDGALRDPWTQARFWRRSRSGSEVQQKIDELRHSGATYVAQILEEVGPQPAGSWQTNAVPGLGFHQYGLAIDCYPRDPQSGKVLWLDRKLDGPRYPTAVEAYKRYEAAIKSSGAYWGGYFSTPDSGHFQITGEGALSYFGGWAAVDAKLRAKWPHQP